MNVQLACRCGEIRGLLRGATPRNVNRAVCYCDDCQAFLHHLGRADLLDPHGGTDIVQVPPATLTFHRGTERIGGLRLSPKGLYRWYATCCKTPLGNTLTPKVPFVGIAHEIFGDAPREQAFGPPRASILGKFATGGAPEGSTGVNFRFLAGAARNIFRWKLGGQTWPHPFFDRATNAPRYPLTVLSREEREALRPLCGPKP